MVAANPIKSYLSPKVEVRESEIKGLGIFAKSPIVKGEIVFVKGGHIVSKRELYFSQLSYHPIDDDLFLGAITEDEENNVKIFVNHSCEPNCGIRGEITFVAMRDIIMGEELTFDYATLDNEDYKFNCSCGAISCRKIVTGLDWKKKEIQIKYRGYFARYLEDKIIKESS